MYAPYREPRIHIALIALAVVLAAVSIVLALLNLSFFKTSYMSYGVFIQTIEDILITCLLAVVVTVQILIIRQLYHRRGQPGPQYAQPIAQPTYAPYPQPAQYRPPQPPAQPGPLAPPPRPPQTQYPQPPSYVQTPTVQQPTQAQIPAIFEESIESTRARYPQPPRGESVLRPPTQPTQVIPRSGIQRQPMTRPQPPQKPSEKSEEGGEGELK